MSTILITGATSGIGLEAAVALARQGNRLVLVGRDQKKMNAAVGEVKRRAGVAAPDSWLCDFGSQAQTRKLAADVLAKYDRLDVLVNNAGLATRRREVTKDGIERTLAVNHLGPFLLTNLLLDLLVKSAPARVVNVASVEHYNATMDLSDLGYERTGWNITKAYGRSKLGNVMFTRALAKRIEGKTGLYVNQLKPKEPSKLALDDELAERLWAESARLVKL